MKTRRDLFTIGHSNHTIERFIDLLRLTGVTAIGDVRSMPFSRWVPHFNREPLARSLQNADIAYIFLGEQLGGRPRDSTGRRDRGVDYERLAATDTFKQGLDRVELEASRRRIALMCAERDPLDCHRFLLVSRRLAERGWEIRHILADGSLEGHVATEHRMAKAIAVDREDLFESPVLMKSDIDRAYEARIDRMRRHSVSSSKQ